MKKLMFFVACCVIAGIMNVNALTSVQQESIKKFTINFVEEGLSKKDSNAKTKLTSLSATVFLFIKSDNVSLVFSNISMHLSLFWL